MKRSILLVALFTVLGLGACATPADEHHHGGGWKADYESHHGRY